MLIQLLRYETPFFAYLRKNGLFICLCPMNEHAEEVRGHSEIDCLHT